MKKKNVLLVASIIMFLILTNPGLRDYGKCISNEYADKEIGLSAEEVMYLTKDINDYSPKEQFKLLKYAYALDRTRRLNLFAFSIFVRQDHDTHLDQTTTNFYLGISKVVFPVIRTDAIEKFKS